MVEGEILDDNGKDPYKGKVKIMVSEPSIGWIHHAIYDNRKDFMMELSRLEARTNYKFFTMNTGRLIISYARELIAEQAVKENMDYLLFIDDDMMFSKDLLDHLMPIMENTDAHMVAPLCVARNYPYEPVVYQLTVVDKEKDGNFKLKSRARINIPKNEVVDVMAVGFGVVLIDMKVFKEVPPPWFFSGQQVGEDILFCTKCHDHIKDFKIKINTGFNVGHMSEPEIVDIRKFDSIKGTDHYRQYLKDRGIDLDVVLKEEAKLNSKKEEHVKV